MWRPMSFGDDVQAGDKQHVMWDGVTLQFGLHRFNGYDWENSSESAGNDGRDLGGFISRIEFGAQAQAMVISCSYTDIVYLSGFKRAATMKKRNASPKRGKKNARAKKRDVSEEESGVSAEKMDVSEEKKDGSVKKKKDVPDHFGVELFSSGRFTQPKNPYFVTKIRPRRRGDLKFVIYFGSSSRSSKINGRIDTEKLVITELAFLVMDKLLKMAQLKEPLWVSSMNPNTIVVDKQDYVRYCKKNVNGTWAVVDISIDRYMCMNQVGKCLRKPSGCLIDVLPNRDIKHIDVDNDDNKVVGIYKALFDSGMAFGASITLDYNVGSTI
nr:homeobox-leucine zipper protein MERISTEM L1-like [Ipomoea batatas]